MDNMDFFDTTNVLDSGQLHVPLEMSLTNVQWRNKDWKSFELFPLNPSKGVINIEGNVLDNNYDMLISGTDSIFDADKGNDAENFPMNDCISLSESWKEYYNASSYSCGTSIFDSIYQSPQIPSIYVLPASPSSCDFNPITFRSQDRSFLTIPPKPSRGDYYGKACWNHSRLLFFLENPCVGRNQKIDDRLIELKPEEETYVCNIRRIHYTRGDDSSFTSTYSKFYYKYNQKFDCKNPYSTEYVRYSQDSNGEIYSYSKAGLCPFCPHIVFKNMNSQYNEHLYFSHGITRDNQIVPNPKRYGVYRFLHEGGEDYHYTAIKCPTCDTTIKVANTGDMRSLRTYMRHYRDKHL